MHSIQRAGIVVLALSMTPAVVAQEVLRVDLGAAAGALHGADLATIADVDFDGVPDYAVGAPGYDLPLGFGAFVPDHGRVEVRSGADGGLLYSYSPPSPNLNGAKFGQVVEELGEVGLFGVGALSEEVNGEPRGRARIFRAGPFGGVVEAFTFDGVASGEQLGTSILGLPDVTGDGIADIAVGGPRMDFQLPFGEPLTDVGGVRVYNGLTGSQVSLVLGGVEQGLFGSRMATVADYDGDGKRDFAVGAPNLYLSGVPGYVRIVSSNGSFTPLETFTGPADGYGAILHDLGDVDGGGARDLLIGGAALTAPGHLEVRRGEDGTVLWTAVGNDAFFGVATTIGDFDGDGLREIAVSDRNGSGPIVMRFLNPATGLEQTSIASFLYPFSSGLDVLPDPFSPAERLLCGVTEIEANAGAAMLLDPFAPAPGPSTVRVDAAGGGDFESLAVATVMSGAGSTYLVSPGSYADVLFEKAATVLGSILGGVEIDEVRVRAAPRFTLSGVSLDELSMHDVPGRCAIVNCAVYGSSSVVLGCADVLLQNTVLWPQESYDENGAVGLIAMGAATDHMQLASCDVRGGDGDDSSGPVGARDGGAGMQVSGYELLLSRSSVRGGDAGALMAGQSSAFAGYGGPAILAVSSAVDFRGGDVPTGLRGGLGSLPAFDSVDVDLEGSAAFVGSGLDFFDLPTTDDPGSTSLFLSARPMLGATGNFVPGGEIRFEVLDDAGTPGVLLLSLGAAVLPLPGLETTPLFVDLTTLVTSFSVSGIGFGTPSVLIVPIAANPAFIGLQLHGQVAMLPTLGTYEGSNAILAAIGF